MSDPSSSLDRLHDVVPPPGIGWWPLAPGWYVIGAIVLTCILILGYRVWKRWQANAYRRAALRELEGASSVNSVALILRRTALVLAPRTLVAGKTGDSWVDWLASLLSDPMPDSVRHQLSVGIYGRPEVLGDVEPLRRYADQWIRHHQPVSNSHHSTSTTL